MADFWTPSPLGVDVINGSALMRRQQGGAGTGSRVFTVGEAVLSTDAWNLLSCSSKYEKELKELLRRFKSMNLLSFNKITLRTQK